MGHQFMHSPWIKRIALHGKTHNLAAGAAKSYQVIAGRWGEPFGYGCPTAELLRSTELSCGACYSWVKESTSRAGLIFFYLFVAAHNKKTS